MPKKTREEKIKAAQRRFKLLYHEPHVPVIESPTVEKKPEFKPKFPSVVNSKTAQTDSRLTYFKKDLKKSLVIVAGIITLEILLYFASINQYLKLN